MKTNKSNLDEMQEMKLLKIEHNGYQIAFCGLIVAILAQTLMGHGNIEYIVGECFVLIPMCIYMTVACVKNGIWERKLKPNAKTNALLSVIAGTVMGLVWFFVSYRNYHKLGGSVAVFIFMFLFISLLSFALLTVTCSAYKKRKNQLEKEEQNEE